MLPFEKQQRNIESIDFLPNSKFLAIQFSSQQVMFARLDEQDNVYVKNAFILPNLIDSEHFNGLSAAN